LLRPPGDDRDFATSASSLRAKRSGAAILYFTGFHILLKIKNLRIKSDTLNPAHFQNPKGFKFKRRLSERINAV
jgi:hypothetical protein